MKIPIIVLTPIKNEEWILNNFLQVTSNFADKIILADQHSTDNSRTISKKYSKVHLIKNPRHEYDESYRQNLLIQEARNLIPGNKIILGIDADEILTADSLDTREWKRLQTLNPGSVLYFKKPDLYNSLETVLFFDNYVPLGFIDDGSPHKSQTLHSTRIPIPCGAHKVYLSEIKFMHYAMLRMNSQKSKNRLYSALSNICEGGDSLTSTLKRRKRHSRHYNYSAGALIKSTPKSWFLGWEKKGINIRKFGIDKYYSQDEQLIDIINKHGEKKFWYDDIWHDEDCNFDLNNCREFFYKKNKAIRLKNPFEKPPMLLRIFLMIFDFYIKKRYYS